MATLEKPLNTSLEVDSNAPTAQAAVREAEEWAKANGYTVAPGVPPRRVARNGHFIYRVLCLRLLTERELRARRLKVKKAFAVLESMPSTKHPYFE